MLGILEGMMEQVFSHTAGKAEGIWQYTFYFLNTHFKP